MENNPVRLRKNSKFQQVPWLAFASLLVALGSIGASVVIIVASNNRDVGSWKIQPSVLLGFLAPILNLALGTAFSVGVVITWWISAIDGASLAELHYIWDRGQGPSFFSALAAGNTSKKVVGTATFLAIVNIATAPLLQRATHQRIDDIVTQESLQLHVIENLPQGWTGSIVNASEGVIFASSDALATAQAWWYNDTMYSLDAPGYYCDGTCQGNVPGAGIVYNCSSTTQPLNLMTGNGTVIFAINTTMSQDTAGAPFLLLTTLYSSDVDDNCTATLTIDTCNIEAGIVQYPVILQNSTITLDSGKLDNVTALATYVYPGDLPTATEGTPAGTLQGLNDFFGFYLFATTSVLNPSSYTGSSMLADMFYKAEPSGYDNYTWENCHLKWSSPTSYVLNTMQNFMFRAALLASNGTASQTFTAQRTKPTLVFHSDYGFLAAALVLTLLALFFVLFMLQGWWVLGRIASLSPLETARAFCATVLARAGHHFTIDGILEEVGEKLVRYIDGEMIIQGGQIHNVEAQARDGENVSIIAI